MSPARCDPARPGTGQFAAACRAAMVPASAPRQLRVLVVDDNEADRRLTAIQLAAAWPFERDLALEHATDGSQAIAMLRRDCYALVVLDWNLPVMDGGEVLRTIRREGMRTPVVVVSGMSRQEIGQDLESLGAGFLDKHQMTPDTLRGVIANSLCLLGFLVPGAGDDLVHRLKNGA